MGASNFASGNTSKVFAVSMNREEIYKDKWYLVKKGDEYFAEKEVILPYSEIKKKVLHRDFNGDVLSLGKDKEWAEQWIYDKNEIDGYL